MKIGIQASNQSLSIAAKQLAEELNLTFIDDKTESYPLILRLTTEKLELVSLEQPKLKPISVDFLQGKLAHRHLYGGGKGQLIARACGLKKLTKPTVLDVTAGLGQDAFILATLGCQVTMIERANALFALLRDGLARAQKIAWFQQLNLKLIHADSTHYLTTLSDKPNVIYLDPMFPEKSKSALVKKEMRLLRSLVGDDIDAQQLLSVALEKATHRVVVKRARHAPTLTTKKPTMTYAGRSTRFDVYLCQPID